MESVYVVFGRDGDFRWPISAHPTYEAAQQAMLTEPFENRTAESRLEVMSVPFRRVEHLGQRHSSVSTHQESADPARVRHRCTR